MKHMHIKPVPLHHTPPHEDVFALELPHKEKIAKSPVEKDFRSSRLRRQGSKFITALRTLGNSVSTTSLAESTILSPSNLSGRDSLISPVPNNSQLDPTIVHRTQFKSRPSIISFQNSIKENSQEILSSTYQSSSNSGDRLSALLPLSHDSKEMGSLQTSKLSIKSSTQNYSFSENKFFITKSIAGEACHSENSLTPIAEGVNLEMQTKKPIPKKAASAKIFFECHYNKLISSHVTPRSLRRGQLERLMCLNQYLTALKKEEIRQSLSRDESEHLRRARVMKSSKIKNKKHDVNTSMYEVIKVLGKGSFGVVRLVREKLDCSDGLQPKLDRTRESGEVYAMKVIKKSSMIQNSQEGHIHAERDFFVAAEGSRWVVPLIASFQDTANLYLVMEFMPGGDFLGLLIRENILSEPVTKWYIAEMILCIQEAHNLRWIHRDIKPDNFLISASGHLRISDFGLAFDGHWSHDQSYFSYHRYSLLAKLGLSIEGDSIDKKEGKTVATAMKISQVMMDEKERHEIDSSDEIVNLGILNWRNKHSNRSFARSVVGTSQYMAPEVIRGENYDARCDWWSLGIIIYECLYGHTPFLSEAGGREQTKLNIISHKSVFGFPQNPTVSRKCQDLIRSIIQEKESRICSKRYRAKDLAGNHQYFKDYAGYYVYPNDAEDIKAHKWFRDIPWDRLHLMTPPVIPELQSLEDTRYFDEEEPISDFSESFNEAPHAQDDIVNVLSPFNREIQKLIEGYLELPFDSLRRRKFEKEIDQLVISQEQKQYLKAVLTLYGQKEKKRPRDRILRDKAIGPKVLELRKEGAFLGYTYRRFRPRQRFAVGSFRQCSNTFGSTKTETQLNRSRLSIN